jgi:phage head maturation protease
MPEYLRAYYERADGASTTTGDVMRFVASTADVARDGMVIDAGAWQLDNFRKNPVFLFSHDYFSRPPIGKVTTVAAEDGRLVADVVFDQNDEFARGIERKYRDGFLSAVSVGWDTVEMSPATGQTPPRVTKADLLDVSAVMVPADPNALKERQKRGLAEYGRELVALLDDEPDPDEQPEVNAELAWRDAVVHMAHVYHPDSEEADDERLTRYRQQVRVYKRLGKTPPEFRTAEELAALSGENRRGLFLEGEPDVYPHLFPAGIRAGAVLSKRNADDLDQAIALIQGVRARAGTQEDQDQETERNFNLIHQLVTGA